VLGQENFGAVLFVPMDTGGRANLSDHNSCVGVKHGWRNLYVSDDNAGYNMRTIIDALEIANCKNTLGFVIEIPLVSSKISNPRSLAGSKVRHSIVHILTPIYRNRGGNLNNANERFFPEQISINGVVSNNSNRQYFFIVIVRNGIAERKNIPGIIVKIPKSVGKR
jgi:hypothetical protein